MPPVSENPGSNTPDSSAPEIVVEDSTPQNIVVVADDLSAFLAKDNVSISLKYYQDSCECFSDWEKRELKKFSGLLKKISGYDGALLRRTKALCDMHKGAPSRARFGRPSEISPLLRD